MKNNIQTTAHKLSFSKGIVENVPSVKVDDPILSENGINLIVKREDMIHPYLSGNKYYKLKHNF